MNSVVIIFLPGRVITSQWAGYIKTKLLYFRSNYKPVMVFWRVSRNLFRVDEFFQDTHQLLRIIILNIIVF